MQIRKRVHVLISIKIIKIIKQAAYFTVSVIFVTFETIYPCSFWHIIIVHIPPGSEFGKDSFCNWDSFYFNIDFLDEPPNSQVHC